MPFQNLPYFHKMGNLYCLEPWWTFVTATMNGIWQKWFCMIFETKLENAMVFLYVYFFRVVLNSGSVWPSCKKSGYPVDWPLGVTDYIKIEREAHTAPDIPVSSSLSFLSPDTRQVSEKVFKMTPDLTTICLWLWKEPDQELSRLI